MSEEYGNDFIVITDDEGNEFELEHLDTAELGDSLYMAFLPADIDEDDEEFGMIILKVVEENGEELFVTIDDDEELEAAYELFSERLFAEEGDEPAEGT